jgi:hypothetical protein
MMTPRNYEHQALTVLLCFAVTSGICGIVICSVAGYLLGQEGNRVGIHVMAAGFAFVAGSAMCFLLYLRALCVQQSLIPVAQPVTVASVTDNPTVVLVVGIPLPSVGQPTPTAFKAVP